MFYSVPRGKVQPLNDTRRGCQEICGAFRGASPGTSSFCSPVSLLAVGGAGAAGGGGAAAAFLQMAVAAGAPGSRTLLEDPPRLPLIALRQPERAAVWGISAAKCLLIKQSAAAINVLLRLTDLSRADSGKALSGF